MKKILPLLLIPFILCSCGGKKVAVQLSSIAFTAEISYYNESYKGECKTDADGGLTVTVCEPESLSGYTVTLKGEQMTAEYLGLTFTPTENNMPFSGVLVKFYKTLRDISDSSAEAVKKGDSYIFEGGEGAESYTLYISPSGLPQKMELGGGFTVYFYNVSII